MDVITFEQLPKAVANLTKDLSEIKDFLVKNFQPETETEKQENNLITREEAMAFLRVTGATLWRWERAGKVKSYGLGGKRFFKKSELEASLIQKK